MKICAANGRINIVLILLAVLPLVTVGENPELSVDGNPTAHKKTALIVSPLFGWVKNESSTSGISDTSPEQGLFVMYATPRIVINNTTFFSDVSNSEVWGNIVSVNLYGDPEKKFTWYLGGSYVWHKIQTATVEITVTEPLGKVGVVWRIPELHLSINPYIGYGRVTETVEFPSAWHMSDVQNRSDIAVCGVSAYWRWRMLHANAKYYMAKDLDHETLNHNFRIWGTAMFNQRIGVIARLEYEEQNTTKDTSLLFGPVFVF